MYVCQFSFDRHLLGAVKKKWLESSPIGVADRRPLNIFLAGVLNEFQAESVETHPPLYSQNEYLYILAAYLKNSILNSITYFLKENVYM